MTNLELPPWSEAMRLQTREAIALLPVMPDVLIHFKHPALGYAYATLDDLMQERLLLHSKTSEKTYRFEAVDSLLQSGWAMD